jgi:co-chaperonin GroES (HSP10)
MRLLGNRVLVEMKKPEEKTQSGIIILEDTQEQKPEGFIKAVGEDVQGNIKVGDEVMFRNYGQMINIEGKDYMLLHEPDILAIID